MRQTYHVMANFEPTRLYPIVWHISSLTGDGLLTCISLKLDTPYVPSKTKFFKVI